MSSKDLVIQLLCDELDKANSYNEVLTRENKRLQEELTRVTSILTKVTLSNERKTLELILAGKYSNIVGEPQ